jgi:predicted permease
MKLANIAFEQILIMIILMLVGVLSAKLNILDEATNKKLSSFLMLIVTPAVVIVSYSRPFETELLTDLIWAFFLSLISFSIAVIVSSIIFKTRKQNSYPIEKFALAFPNVGFLGIPLINGIFGSTGVFFVTAYLSVVLIFLWTYGTMLMTGKSDLKSIKKALLSPVMISIYVGFVIFIFSISLPNIVYAPISFLSGMNAPLAMLIAGVSLANIDLKATIKIKRVYFVSAISLIVLPSLTVLAFLPFNISPIVFGTIIIASACPAAANIIPFAYQYEKDHVLATQIFAMSTLLSLFTIPFILLLI